MADTPHALRPEPGFIRLSTQGEFATLVGVTMSIHKLTAGSGYDYLTRQVAAQDRTEGARPGLASYYTERGETPGVWVGSGLAGIDGLTVGDEVTRRPDAVPVRVRAPPARAAAAGTAAGSRADRARLPGGRPVGGAVPGVPRRRVAVSGRGRRTDR